MGVISGRCGLQLVCLVHQMILPIPATSFSQGGEVMFKLLFVCYYYSFSLEEQEEPEEREDHIYISHLEAILQTIPLEKDLDHLLAS